MGGSMGLALRRRGACRQVWGIARRPESVERAIELGAIDGGTCDLSEGVAGADIVVLAVPVRVIISLTLELRPMLPKGCLLLDVGSTKVEVLRAMENLPSHVECIGGHPMAGKESSGIEAAEASLYGDSPFILTPLARTSENALGLALSLVRALGSRPLLLSAEEHDRLVVTISHLPYVLSVASVRAALEAAEDDERIWSLAAGGFRDTSRLAASGVPMSLDMLMTNKENVLGGVKLFTRHLEGLMRLLEEGDEATLRQVMEAARRKRREMFL